MAMTTPVMMKDEGKKMSFIMPSAYWEKSTIANAPSPMDESGVVLEAQEEQIVAVMWFGGYSSQKTNTDQKIDLLRRLESDGAYVPVDAQARPYVMQYNDPFQPPWSRRNEVAIAVKPVGVSVEI